MGNSKSQQTDSEHLGYRVLGVQPQSPAAKGGLVSFFDFIVAANGVPLKSLDTTFIELIKASEDKPLPLNVYNCKNHSVREVTLIPSRKWPGEGMLGVTIRFDSYFEAEESMCHVLEVETNSPAELAGLVPFKDYLLGTAEKAFKDTDILNEELIENVDKPVEFYVYNTDSDEVRTVVIMPTKDWGGEGILGANVAHGYLHVLPSTCCNTIGMSNEGAVNKIMNSPFGHNEAAISQIYNQPSTDTTAVSSSQPSASWSTMNPSNLPSTEQSLTAAEKSAATVGIASVPLQSPGHQQSTSHMIHPSTLPTSHEYHAHTHEINRGQVSAGGDNIGSGSGYAVGSGYSLSGSDHSYVAVPSPGGSNVFYNPATMQPNPVK